MKRIYDLTPLESQGQKSFYGKAKVIVEDTHEKYLRTLYSYGIPVCSMDAEGTVKRLWSGWSATMGKHVKAFCGLNKSEFLSLALEA